MQASKFDPNLAQMVISLRENALSFNKYKVDEAN